MVDSLDTLLRIHEVKENIEKTFNMLPEKTLQIKFSYVFGNLAKRDKNTAISFVRNAPIAVEVGLFDEYIKLTNKLIENTPRRDIRPANAFIIGFKYAASVGATKDYVKIVEMLSEKNTRAVEAFATGVYWAVEAREHNSYFKTVKTIADYDVTLVIEFSKKIIDAVEAGVFKKYVADVKTLAKKNTQVAEAFIKNSSPVIKTNNYDKYSKIIKALLEKDINAAIIFAKVAPDAAKEGIFGMCDSEKFLNLLVKFSKNNKEVAEKFARTSLIAMRNGVDDKYLEITEILFEKNISVALGYIETVPKAIEHKIFDRFCTTCTARKNLDALIKLSKKNPDIVDIYMNYIPDAMKRRVITGYFSKKFINALAEHGGKVEFTQAIIKGAIEAMTRNTLEKYMSYASNENFIRTLSLLPTQIKTLFTTSISYVIEEGVAEEYIKTMKMVASTVKKWSIEKMEEIARVIRNIPKASELGVLKDYIKSIEVIVEDDIGVKAVTAFAYGFKQIIERFSDQSNIAKEYCTNEEFINTLRILSKKDYSVADWFAYKAPKAIERGKFDEYIENVQRLARKDMKSVREYLRKW